MKTFQRVGALILVMAMLLPFGMEFASAEWNSTVGYYGSVTMEMLEEKLVHENKQVDVHFLEIAYDEDMGAYRLRYMDTGAWYLNTEGTFPYVLAAGDVPATDIAVENTHSNQWLGLTERSKEVETVTQDALASAVIELNDAGIDCSLVKGYYNEILYYFICTPDYKYYCNSKGEMFVAPAEASATDLNRPHYNDDGDTMETPVIDRDNQTLNLPMSDGTVVNLTIDNMTYDDGDKSYTVNAYTTINEGDEYHYTYYTYNVQYNITNTYITYIGSNEPYEREEYELYYELPDGRSSADLTAEEIAGMSFEFYDVVNYARSTEDVSVRALYHFDGNTTDSSYFTASDRFAWLDGASITYMESPSPFEGNLYLDNTAHSFSIGLPSALGASDFTIQFRYYQASEPDTQSNIENGILLSGVQAVSWDEQSVYSGSSTTALAKLPVGTWNEIALVRSGGTLYIYLNGLSVGTADWSSQSVSRILTFNFGSTSRAYSMIDELRVLNFAIAENGGYYEPTVVPHDSNLVLVLPDSELPIADEYFELTGTGNNLLGFDFTSFTSGEGGSVSPLTYNSSHSSVTYNSDSLTLSRLTSSLYSNTLSYNGYSVNNGICGGLYVKASDLGLSANKQYTLSVVLADGTIQTHTFTTPSTIQSGSEARGPQYWTEYYGTQGGFTSSLDFGVGQMGYARFGGGSKYTNNNSAVYVVDYLCIIPSSAGGSLDILYIELVEGSSTDLAAEKVTSVYSGIDLEPNTAAIQTTIPVNGYTVGGVRPSMPAKGDLWFPVMENRITGVQIYAGTHWEEVNARWWTGSRWIPIYAFDINTLEDLFDIADGDDVVSLLPDTNSFFRWWQLQWLDFRQWLEKTLGSGGGCSASDCQHVYTSEVTRYPGCIEPGITTFTCSNCGHKYIQTIDAHGHDWITTDTVPDVLDDAGTVIEEGYDILTCSICDTTARDYGDGPEEDDLFDALGDLLAGGVEWILDKLTQLADRLRLITDTFKEYVEKVKGFGGEFPAFFAAAFALFPEELRILLWLAVIGVVVLAVWKKYSS